MAQRSHTDSSWQHSCILMKVPLALLCSPVHISQPLWASLAQTHWFNPSCWCKCDSLSHVAPGGCTKPLTASVMRGYPPQFGGTILSCTLLKAFFRVLQGNWLKAHCWLRNLIAHQKLDNVFFIPRYSQEVIWRIWEAGERNLKIRQKQISVCLAWLENSSHSHGSYSAHEREKALRTLRLIWRTLHLFLPSEISFSKIWKFYIRSNINEI